MNSILISRPRLHPFFPRSGRYSGRWNAKKHRLCIHARKKILRGTLSRPISSLLAYPVAWSDYFNINEWQFRKHYSSETFRSRFLKRHVKIFSDKFEAKIFSQLFKLNTKEHWDNWFEGAEGMKVRGCGGEGIPFQGLLASSIPLQVRRMISA